MNNEIVPNSSYADLPIAPQVLEYIDLLFQYAPIIDKALDLGHVLSKERVYRDEIKIAAEERRLKIERRMNQLDAELESDFENIKTFISSSMRVFEKMVENGHIEQAMILHLTSN